jgi:hypothetical protein
VAYASVTDVKLYRGISTLTGGTGASTSDDAILTVLVAAAQKQIDSYCGRTFEAASTSERTFDAVTDVDGQRLWLDADLASVSVITNGSGTAVTKYVTEPRNVGPYYAITLKASAAESWEYTDDPEGAISVVGYWAYSTAAPADIKMAATRLAAYLYAQKDSQVFETTMFPDAGVMTVPSGMPKDVQELLRPYRRLS